jgi:hypothetical protein
MKKLFNWFKNLFSKKDKPQPKSTVVEWTDENGVRHAKYTIYVGDLSIRQKDEVIGKIMYPYEENINFDNSLGELTINGSASIAYKKDYFFPVNND